MYFANICQHFDLWLTYRYRPHDVMENYQKLEKVGEGGSSFQALLG